jgi:hypothetical protein
MAGEDITLWYKIKERDIHRTEEDVFDIDFETSWGTLFDLLGMLFSMDGEPKEQFFVSTSTEEFKNTFGFLPRKGSKKTYNLGFSLEEVSK